MGRHRAASALTKAHGAGCAEDIEEFAPPFASMWSAGLEIVDAAKRGDGKLVVVDAIDDEAAAFYKHDGFAPVPGSPHRLVMKMSTVARELDIPWP